MFDFDDLEDQLAEAKIERPARSTQPEVRIWALSDVHADDAHNREWLQHMDTADTANDVIIIAGDISHHLEVIRKTLLLFKQRFAKVFFCPGNHELWITGKATREDSLDRLQHLLQLCKQLGVETHPAEIEAHGRRVLVVPLLSWHHPQWDTEPDIEGWQGLVPVEEMLNDYFLTSWPEGIKISDGSAAQAVDELNDGLFDWKELLRKRCQFNDVVSFSHFLPRVELNPEKRYLTYPNLAKSVGSTYLRARVDALHPDVHVFGHTHFGYDLTVDGVRYLQAPLSMSSERASRGTTVSLGSFPEAAGPFLVWHSKNGWSPPSQGAWSAYLARYGRRPDVTSLLPAYVADAGLRPAAGAAGALAKVGWLPGRMPVWLFGQRQQRKIEAESVVQQVNKRLLKEAAGSASLPKSHEEPEPISAAEVSKLLQANECKVIDIRQSTGAACPASATPLPHPTMTSAFPGLPDAELLSLTEQLMANDGPRVLVGDADDASGCRKAALLLASLLRLWPRDVRPLKGGFDAWCAYGLPVNAE